MELSQTLRPGTTTSTSSRPDGRKQQPPFRKRTFKPRDLRDAGVAPIKARGQHFLTDRRILGRIADACELNGSETVIEIGPGLGALTERLAETAAKVVAIEIDSSLAVRLQERLAARKNVSIFEADALSADPKELLAGDQVYVLAGNLPYNPGLAIV